MNTYGSQIRRTLLYLSLVVAAGVLARLVMAAAFPVLISPDTASYLDLARMISGWDLSGYNGARTPIYPLLILLSGLSPERTVLVQHILGLITGLLVYFIFLRITGKPRWALAAALVAVLNPGMIAFERAVLTESLTALLLAGTTLALLMRAGRSSRYLILPAVLAALAVLTRPAMIFLPPLLALLVFRETGNLPLRLRRALIAVLPGVVLVLLWSGVVQRETGQLSLTTVGGAALINHAGAFIDDSQPQDDVAARIYLRHRKQRIEDTGRQTSTFWYARWEIMDSTGMSYPELDARFKHMAVGLIRSHPLRYAGSVAVSFVRFWRATWYTARGGIIETISTGTLPMKLLVGGFLMVHSLLTGCFLLLPLLWLLSGRFRQALKPNWDWAVLYSIVFAGAALQALADAGDNPRYGVPFEPLVLSAGIVMLLAVVQAVRKKLAACGR